MLHVLINDLLLARTGIFIAPERIDHLAYCVRAACRDAGHDDPERYLRQLRKHTLDHAVWQRLLHHLAIGETYLFREAEMLYDHVLPTLIRRRRADRSYTLRLWSAGCATGEEPYTLALMLRDLLPDIAGWQITILGTDINTQALAQARRGRYSLWSMRGNIPQSAYAHLAARGSFWQLSETVRRMVEFRFHNLVENQPGLLNADLILCRNVLYYLGPERRPVVVERLKTWLAPDGQLLLSHSASVGHSYHPEAGHAPQSAPLREPARSPSEEAIERAKRAADQAKWEEAHHWLDRAEAQDRLYLPVHYLRALIYEGQGQTAAAIRALERCLYLDRNFALGHFMLGNLLARGGDDSLARRHWQNARALLSDRSPEQALELSEGLTVQNALELIRTFLGEVAI